jgi:hypothetical protein
MMIRFRDLEVPVAVGLLVLSAFLGITGWNRQPSNGTEITGGQIGVPPVFLVSSSECLEDGICSGTGPCGTHFDDLCAGWYEWKSTGSEIQTNCFATAWWWCAIPAQGPQAVICATATKKCKRFVDVKFDDDGTPHNVYSCGATDIEPGNPGLVELYWAAPCI